MKEGQDKIYYLAGDNLESVKHSPQLEGFLKNDIEVILLTDAVDDFWVNVNHTYKGKEIVSITRAGLDLDFIKDKKEEKKEEDKSEDTDKILNLFKTTLGNKVFSVVESKKLADSPVCLTTQEGGMDMRMERFLVSQRQLATATPKVLEVNTSHCIVKFIGKHSTSDKAKDLIELLFDEACIIEGETITDPSAFSKRFNKFLESVLDS
jgi:molecular chaperone HtpG